MDHLYVDGRHYDRLFSPSGDIEFFVDQARTLSGPVLELACGTGRILQPIADVGFAATGIDLSPGMLAEARRKALSGSSSVRYIQADIRSFSLGERFALIFIAGNSICHLLDTDSFQACMARVREHLAARGRFIVDVYVPKLQFLQVDPEVRLPFSEYDDPDGAGRVVVTQTSRYDAITQIKSVKTFHKFPGETPEVEGSLELKMYFPQELQALLHYNGLRLLAAYGGYDKTPLANTSAKQIYVMEAA
ncbi:MAG TPA: class I SAM-dependent methyltransferase [Steroidobacteraceae bacterium]|nr:class I SAM-dependent methyltransferase [Steroidobacteraceae bacterium]